MKQTLEKGKLSIIQHPEYIEAEYILPKLRNQPACAVVTNLFNSSVLKKVAEFDTWKDTIFEKIQKKQYTYICIYESTLLYSYKVKLLKNSVGKYFWKLNIMIGTEASMAN